METLRRLGLRTTELARAQVATIRLKLLKIGAVVVSQYCKRHVLAKAEHSERGANPRHVLTNLSGAAQQLYDELYCARGEMENRIKEQQLGLFSDRTRPSSHPSAWSRSWLLYANGVQRTKKLV
jgi:Transposase DDE domain group 1